MSVEMIKSSLIELFSSPLKDGERRKIVYWQDIDGSLEEEFNNIEIENVKKHRLVENNYFKTKYLLEVEDIKSNFLIYTQENLDVKKNEYPNEDNWLIDNILYSTVFYADPISIYCRELGISNELRKIVLDNEKFFRATIRRQRFGSYNIEMFTEEKIELGIISVLTNQKSISLEDSLRTILMENLDEKNNKYIKQIETYFNIQKFWKYVEKYYGYKEESKSLKRLLIHIMINTMSTIISEDKLTTLNNFVEETGKGNCAIFLDRWMNHKTDYEVYDQYALEIEEEILFSRILQYLEVEDIRTIDIFPSIDQAIILYIVDDLENRLEDFEEYLKLLRLRKTKHFYNKYKHIYEGLLNVVKMFEYRKRYPYTPVESPQKMIESYANSYYLMDQYYRKFYIAYDKRNNSQVLQKLKNMVEGIYSNQFMVDLSYNWSQSIENNLGETWNISDIDLQRDFYSKYIYPKYRDNERVFVIISDALRYDIAAELCDILDADSLGSAELVPLLGGLPSTTKFGMARLLPHSELDLRSNGFIYVDKINSGSMEGRRQILSKTTEESTAINYNEYMGMTKDQLREYYRGSKLNYIYHNTIDAIGDDASTEIKVFDSTKTALEELQKLINSLRGNLSATNIFITSDHGFIYQREKLAEVDKINRDDLDPVESSRRHILSKESRDVEGLLRFTMNATLGEDSNLNVFIPKANIRFKMQGPGANYVHGGASLQEIVLPLIIYKNKVKGQIGAVKPKKTQIKLTNTTRRITNSIFSLNFFQTERVGGKIVPCSVRVYFEDTSGEIISDEKILLGDKTSQSPEDRTMDIQFILKQGSYDRNKDYYLIIKDIQTGIEYERIPFTISLGIGADFDF